MGPLNGLTEEVSYGENLDLLAALGLRLKGDAVSDN
jgi:hypothetical protein